MILSDKTLKQMISERGLVQFNPSVCEKDQIQPASVDIRLGNSFSYAKVPKRGYYTLDSKMEYETVEQDEFLLSPGQFVLATTQEYFNLPDDITAFVEGRSSIGRMGLFIQNAGWVDPGFKGEITLEVFNASPYPILLKAGERVGQLVFARMDTPAEKPYRGKYQGQKGATGSKKWMDNSFTF